MTHADDLEFGDEAFAELVRQSRYEVDKVTAVCADVGDMLAAIKRQAADNHARAAQDMLHDVPSEQRELQVVGAELTRAFRAPMSKSGHYGVSPSLEEQWNDDEWRELATSPSCPEDEIRQVHVEGYAETSWDLSIVVADASRGNRAAIKVLLNRIQPLIVRYCRARIGKMRHLQSEPDELAREVCIAVLTALPGYRAKGRPFLAFVYGIAANKIAHWTQVNELESATDQRVMPDSETHLAESDNLAQMTELLSRLPSKQRDILVLRVACGLSAEETADAIGSTPGAVRVAQHRALTRLREEIARLELM